MGEIAAEILAGARCDQCGRPLAESKGVPTTCRHCKKEDYIHEKRMKQAVPDGPVEFTDIERSRYKLEVVKEHLMLTGEDVVLAIPRDELTRILPNLNRFSMRGRLKAEFPNG
jgi:uncharacterized Zn finger protein (UPF0148 family)